MMADSGETSTIPIKRLEKSIGEFLSLKSTKSYLYFERGTENVVAVTHFAYTLDPFSFIIAEGESVLISAEFRRTGALTHIFGNILMRSFSNGSRKAIGYYYKENKEMSAYNQKMGIVGLGAVRYQ